MVGLFVVAIGIVGYLWLAISICRGLAKGELEQTRLWEQAQRDRLERKWRP